jgi:hypothetical protein
MYTSLLSGIDDKERGPQQILKTVDGPKQIIQLQYVSPRFITFRQAHYRVTHTVYYLCTTQHMVSVIKKMVVYMQHALRVTETRMSIIRFMITCLLHIAYVK